MLYVTDGYESLYDMRQDPLEKQDVLSKHAGAKGMANEMRRRVSAYIRSEEAYLKGADPGK